MNKEKNNKRKFSEIMADFVKFKFYLKEAKKQENARESACKERYMWLKEISKKRNIGECEVIKNGDDECTFICYTDCGPFAKTKRTNIVGHDCVGFDVKYFGFVDGVLGNGVQYIDTGCLYTTRKGCLVPTKEYSTNVRRGRVFVNIDEGLMEEGRSSMAFEECRMRFDEARVECSLSGKDSEII